MTKCFTRFDEKRVRRLRRLSVVPRWAIIHTIQRQNVAEHSYHVAWIALWLLQFLRSYSETVPSHRMMMEAIISYGALVHDEAEALSGDIATPYKIGRMGDEIKRYESEHKLGACRLSEEHQALLKLADLLEAAVFIYEEGRLGNPTLNDEIMPEIRAKITKVWHELDTNDEAPADIQGELISAIGRAIPGVEGP